MEEHIRRMIKDIDSKNQIREALAEYAHMAWSRWMQYIFVKSGCVVEPGIMPQIVIPYDLVELWTKQMTTPYMDLPEDEKESDRQEADRLLAIMHRFAAKED